MESQHDDDDPMLYTNSPSGSQHSPPRPPSPRSSPGLTSTASPPGSTSTASSKYLIEETTTTNQHYEEDLFLQRKFLDVAQSYRIVPKAASSSYLDEFKRLSVFLSSRISSYLETHRATKVC